MNVLVLYGTRWGGTEKVAHVIGKAIQEAGNSVEVVDAKKAVNNIDSYDLFIVGSGIRADKWTKEPLEILDKYSVYHKTNKIAQYDCCSMADRKHESCKKGKKRYLNDVAERYGLKTLSLGYFGGLMDFSYSHGLLVDILVRINRKNLCKNGLDTAKVHDTRDWIAIEAWGRDVAKLASTN